MILVVLGGNLEIDGSANLGVIVCYRALYCFFGKNGAMHLYCRKTVESFYYCVICEGESFVDGMSLDKLSCHRGCSNRCTTTEGFELAICDYVVFNI